MISLDRLKSRFLIYDERFGRQLDPSRRRDPRPGIRHAVRSTVDKSTARVQELLTRVARCSKQRVEDLVSDAGAVLRKSVSQYDIPVGGIVSRQLLLAFLDRCARNLI